MKLFTEDPRRSAIAETQKKGGVRSFRADSWIASMLMSCWLPMSTHSSPPRSLQESLRGGVDACWHCPDGRLTATALTTATCASITPMIRDLRAGRLIALLPRDSCMEHRSGSLQDTFISDRAILKHAQACTNQCALTSLDVTTKAIPVGHTSTSRARARGLVGSRDVTSLLFASARAFA